MRRIAAFQLLSFTLGIVLLGVASPKSLDPAVGVLFLLLSTCMTIIDGALILRWP